MKTIVNASTLTRAANAAELPSGKYQGYWSGYQVKFKVADYQYYAETSTGVRGMDIPCLVIVLNGEISIETV